MREPAKDKGRLEHIIESINNIFEFVGNKTSAQIIEDKMCYYAIVYHLVIIGEAANMLTTDFQAFHPETPWKMVKGMRNYIVHEYFQIDSNVVWNVVTQNLPELEAQVTEYLSEG